MPKIFELDQHVADLIAAGEVVGRPASVVKELLENAVDSGAGIITAEISSGGMTFIRVTDNGCGISHDDVKTAFLRHATSKLKNAEDLEAIGTLGFRGEALAAIAAVSRIEMLTREQGADEGVSLILEAGEVKKISPAGCPEGTTIIVRDLFFNTPARQKFMKTDRAEGSAVASVVLQCALSRPDISFRFIKDGKTEYHTPGDSRIDSCIYSLLGRETESGLVPVKTSDDTVSVEGFVSTPEAARGNRSYQFFFVNGRVIRSLLLQSALEQAYKNILPPGRFPSCVLYITTKLNVVDVNVHPAKTEIKFISDKPFFDAVYYAALDALQNENEKLIVERYESIKPDETSKFKTMQADEFRNLYVSEQQPSYKSSGNTSNRQTETSSSKLNIQTISEHFNPEESNFLHLINNGLNTPNNSEFLTFNFPFSTPDIRVVGEVLNVYIVVETENGVWFIDKHAAHERIHFDALNNDSYESMSETLITPVICRLGHEDASVLLDNEAFLTKLGFSVESFGEDSVAVRHIPSEIDIGDTESVLSDLCMLLKHGGTAKPDRLDKIYKTIACKAAIKAGRSSDIQELEKLADLVMSGKVSHCPHGRPVAFEITKSALDKGFGRA